MPDPPAIAVQDVSFAYEAGPRVLEDVSFTVGPRDFLSMVGPNGGGKTTLLRLLLGLLRPDRGRIRLFGTPPEAARPRVGYMAQQTQLDPLFPASALDVALMGRLRRGFVVGPYRARDKRVARQALGEVGLEEAASRSFAALSGGQRQRVLLARALACEPDLLLLDEPTANVDLAVEEELFELLGRLNERMAIVVVSHDIGFVAQYVPKVICVNRRVAVHPTAALEGRMIQDLYGSNVRMVRHDHHFAQEGDG